jgi:hypothetical protein
MAAVNMLTCDQPLGPALDVLALVQQFEKTIQPMHLGGAQAVQEAPTQEADSAHGEAGCRPPW